MNYISCDSCERTNQKDKNLFLSFIIMDLNNGPKPAAYQNDISDLLEFHLCQECKSNFKYLVKGFLERLHDRK